MDNDVNKYRDQFNAFMDATDGARKQGELHRDFVDLKQWTDAEIKILNGRNQASVVFDYIREQLDYFMGVERDKRQDPKAYPRTRNHDDAASAATQALRYIVDNNDFDQTSSLVFEEMWVEGYGACMVEPVKRPTGIEIATTHIPWDRFYYDPHSRKLDFSDATHKGIVLWIDSDEAIKLYPDKEEEIKNRIGSAGNFEGTTFADRPNWFDGKRKRIKVCQHYYKEKGAWNVVHFTGDLILIESQESPLKNEYGEPECPIVAISAYIDRNNNRYGYAKRLIDPQREVNHRRSKALSLLSSRQVFAEDGAVMDEGEASRELKKHDGWVSLNPGALSSGAFQVSDTNDMAQGQLAMYQDAAQKMDKTGANAAMQGDAEGMSGRAINRLQSGGQIQIGSLFDAHRFWKRSVYRQIWYRVKQFWDEEKWIRVTDNEDNLKWVGLNQPVTIGEALREKAQQGDERALNALQQMIAAQDPRLNQQHEIRNNVAEIDIDIVIDESPDVITTQEEQNEFMLELLKQYGPQAIPLKSMIETSAITSKRQIIEMIEGNEDQKQQQLEIAERDRKIQELMLQLEMQDKQQSIEEKAANTELKQAQTMNEKAKTGKTIAESEQTHLENQTISQFPDVRPTVVV